MTKGEEGGLRLPLNSFLHQSYGGLKMRIFLGADRFLGFAGPMAGVRDKLAGQADLAAVFYPAIL